MTYKVATEIDGWLSDSEFLELRKLATGKSVLEIGSWMGRSTVALAESARHVVSIDHFKGDSYTNQPPADLLQQCVTNLESIGIRDKVTMIIGDMRNILPALRAREFDLIFYDAEHSGESTSFALNWALAARAAAVIAVHDYSRDYEHYRDAADAVDYFANLTGRSIRFEKVLAIMEQQGCYRVS